MKLLSTGEFAKLCGTQKGTLFFYDKEGLLKPKYVSENGYRRYGAEQFFEYDMISILKETGSSLKEIKLHLQKRDPESLLRLFEEKRILLKKEKARIARQQKMLDAIVDLTKATLHPRQGVLEVVDLPEEELELMPVSPENQTTAEGCATLFAEFSRKLEEQGRSFPAPFGVMIDRDEAIARRYIASHFFCGGSRSTPKPNLHIRPAGKYAAFLHSGDMDSHEVAYAEMLERVEKSGLGIVGNIYSYDTMSYFITGSAEEYLARYCIQVE
jgi:DNA-binding transcriptional MerR regulator